MSDNRLCLQVMTPDRTALDREVSFLVLRTVEGDMGILPGHEPCAVELTPGVVRWYEDGKPSGTLAVMGGFCTVAGNEVSVLSPVAEKPEELEAALRRFEEERAKRRHDGQAADLEMQRMETALRRSLVKMEISAFSVLQGKDEQS